MQAEVEVTLLIPVSAAYMSQALKAFVTKQTPLSLRYVKGVSLFSKNIPPSSLFSGGRYLRWKASKQLKQLLF